MSKSGQGPSAKRNVGMGFFAARSGGVIHIGLRPPDQNITMEGFLARRMLTLNGCRKLL